LEPEGVSHPGGLPEQASEAAGLTPEIRLESSSERAAVSAAARSVAASASPVQVLSRLTDLQRQMAVEHLALASLSAFKGREESLTLDLNPPELGRVRVVVESHGSQVNAVLTVQDSSVGSFFQENTDTLRRHLEQAGVKVGDLSVEIRQEFGQKKEEQEALRFGGSQERPQEKVRTAIAARSASPGWKAAGLSRVDMTV